MIYGNVKIVGAASAALKKRWTFQLNISSQFNNLHLQWYGAAPVPFQKGPSMLNGMSLFFYSSKTIIYLQEKT